MLTTQNISTLLTRSCFEEKLDECLIVIWDFFWNHSPRSSSESASATLSSEFRAHFFGGGGCPEGSLLVVLLWKMKLKTLSTRLITFCATKALLLLLLVLFPLSDSNTCKSSQWLPVIHYSCLLESIKCSQQRNWNFPLPYLMENRSGESSDDDDDVGDYGDA